MPLAPDQVKEATASDLFYVLRDRVLREPNMDFSAFRELVDELVEERRSYGFFTDDEDLEQIKRDLESHWLEVESEMRDERRFMRFDR